MEKAYCLRSIISLIVLGPLQSLADHLRLVGDPFAITWIWLWIESSIASGMVDLHLFGMILSLVVVFLLAHIRDSFDSLNIRRLQ